MRALFPNMSRIMKNYVDYSHIEQVESLHGYDIDKLKLTSHDATYRWLKIRLLFSRFLQKKAILKRLKIIPKSRKQRTC